MGKGDNKKSTASSTKAAELLAKIGAGRPSAGFGGYVGVETDKINSIQ